MTVRSEDVPLNEVPYQSFQRIDGRWMAFSPIASRVRCLSLVAHDKKGQLLTETLAERQHPDFAPSCFQTRY